MKEKPSPIKVIETFETYRIESPPLLVASPKESCYY